MLRWMLAATICATAACSWAEEQPLTVGILSEPNRLVFRGVHAFSEKDIAAAVQSNLPIAAAGQPSADRQKYLQTLSDEIGHGFQHAGYCQVTVQAAVISDPPLVVLNVVEGSRIARGPVVVHGTHTLPADKLIRLLTTKQPPAEARPEPVVKSDGFVDTVWVDQNGRRVALKSPTWTIGKPAALAPTDCQTIFDQVHEALEQLGYPSARCKIRTAEGAGSTVELHIDVLDEGQPAKIEQITITGNQRNSRAAILAATGIKPGQVMDRELLDHVHRQLYDSGRFVSFQVKPRTLQPNGALNELAIEVDEFENATPLGQEYSREEKALMRFQEWISRFGIGREELDLRIRHHGDSRDTLRAVCSPAGGIALSFQDGHPTNEEFEIDLLAESQALTLLAPQRRRRYTIPQGDLGVTLSIQLTARRDKDTAEVKRAVNFAYAWHNNPVEGEPSLSIATRMTPAYVVAALRTPNAVSRFEGPLLIQKLETCELKIEEETGRLVELKLFDPDTQLHLSIVTSPGGFDRFAAELKARAEKLSNTFQSARPLASTAEFLTPELLDAAQRYSDLQADQARQFRATLALLRTSLEVLDTLDLAETLLDEHEFDIPVATRPNQGLVENLMLCWGGTTVLPMCDRLFPRGSWPWTLSRHVTLSLAGAADRNTSLIAMFSRADCGPLGCLVAAQAAQVVEPDAVLKLCVGGSARLNLDGFHRDTELLLRDDTGLGMCVQALARSLQELDPDDLKAITEMVPADHRPAFSKIVAKLRADRDQPLPTVIAAALDQAWTDVLQAYVNQQLLLLVQKPGDAVQR